MPPRHRIDTRKRERLLRAAVEDAAMRFGISAALNCRAGLDSAGYAHVTKARAVFRRALSDYRRAVKHAGR
jgi:hypothetical protein